MRNYGIVSPKFWIGDTGKSLRGDPLAQVIALYLVTNPHTNMIGLYYLPIPTLIHETGSPLKGACKALARLSEGGFAYYDEATEHVYVPEMARYQIGDTIKPCDNRIKGIVQYLTSSPSVSFAKHFYEKYKVVYGLPEMSFNKPLASPLQAPYKPLRSQEQEQDQEQDQEQEKKDSASPNGATHVACRPKSTRTKVTAEAEVQRWGAAFDEALPDMKNEFSGIDWDKTRQLWLNWVADNHGKTAKRSDPARSFKSWLLAGKWLVRVGRGGRSTEEMTDEQWDAYAKEVEARESQ